MIKKNISSKLTLNALFLILTLLSIISLTLAEETLPSQPPQTAFQQDEKEFQDATLSTSAGITPDSPLYFIDNLLDNFATDASNREEKIAEIRDMIQAGKVDDAKKALSHYQQFAKRTEQDISPDQQEQTRKSAVAISRVMTEIKDDIPAEHQQEFVTDIISQEEKISTAAKVADKIKTLCETLSKLDPQQYAQTCKVKDNEQAPEWQRNLDDKLTAEQQQEARAFFKTMSNCMRDPANCNCDEISIKPFAQKCKVIAPLAAKCEQGDESACDAMDKDTQNIEDLLPPHLQAIMKETDKDFSGAQFENHMPPECQKANIDPKSSNAREQCETIMFQQNAPKECIDAGVKDHKECGKIMFNLKAPPECKDAGLTGESQNDPHQCEKIMQELQNSQQLERQNNNPDQNGNFNNNRGPPGGMGQSFGKNCKDITDQTEKLQCLEEFYNQAQQQQNNFAQNQPESQNQQGEYLPNQFQNNFDPSRAPPECRNTNSPDECRKIMDEKSRQYQQENENKYRNENKESENKEYNPNFYGNAIYPSPDQYQNQPPNQNQNQYPNQYQNQYPQQQYPPQSPNQPCNCGNMQCNSGSYPSCESGSSSCSCRQFDNQQQPYPQSPYPDNQQPQPPQPNMEQPPNMPQPGMEQPNMIPPPNQQVPPLSDGQQPPPQQSPPPPEQNSPPPTSSDSSPPPSSSDSQSSESKESSSSSPDSSSSSGSSSESSSSSDSSSSSSTESTPLTGNAIIDNKFLKFYWKK